MSESLCRWGILGCADIARKNWDAIRHAENATLTAVASRSLDRSQAFTAQCQSWSPFPSRPKALGSYEELLACPEVDAVYIPLPTGVRKNWVIRAIETGRHVLVEKPCGTSAVEVREMVEACQRRGVQMMDGVMYMHSQRLAKLRTLLDEGQKVGEIRRIASQFTFLGGPEFLSDNIRAQPDLEPFGCLGDLGWYTIRFSLWAMKDLLPQAVAARIHRQTQDGVPLELSAELFYNDGVTASFYNSFITENQEWACISGTAGHLHIPDFVLPFKGRELRCTIRNSRFVAEQCRFDMLEGAEEMVIKESSSNAADAQETNMIRKFSSLVLSSRPDPYWPDIALKTQLVMDACLASGRLGGKEVSLPV